MHGLVDQRQLCVKFNFNILWSKSQSFQHFCYKTYLWKYQAKYQGEFQSQHIYASLNALRIATGCLHPSLADNLPILAGIQPAGLRRNGAWTPAPLSAHPSIECSCTAPQIKTPICTRCTTSHQFIWHQQHMCGALGRSPMECEVDRQLHKTPHFPHFHSRHWHPPLEWQSQAQYGLA